MACSGKAARVWALLVPQEAVQTVPGDWVQTVAVPELRGPVAAEAVGWGVELPADHRYQQAMTAKL